MKRELPVTQQSEDDEAGKCICNCCGFRWSRRPGVDVENGSASHPRGGRGVATPHTWLGKEAAERKVKKDP